MRFVESWPNFGQLMKLALVLVVIGLVAFAAAADQNAEWLANKSKEEGVVTLPSGLMYKVLQSGKGKSPKVSTPCTCHYEGKLIDGTVFDSSFSRGQPATFAPNQVIKGWTEAMQKMVEDDIWELYLPPELAYGNRAVGPIIKPNSILVFKLHLMKVNGPGRDEL